MYATHEQMAQQLGQREMLALADRDNTGQYDVALVQNALNTATSEINGALSRRYPLPLTVTVPALTAKAIDIARYHLTGAEVNETQPVRARYKDAMAWLANIANRALNLTDATGQPVPDHPIGGSQPTGSSLGKPHGGRTILPGSLSDYLP